MDSSAKPSANGSGTNPDEAETSQMAAVPPDPVVWPDDPWESEGSASEPETPPSTPQVTSPVIPSWPEAFGEPGIPARPHPQAEPQGDNLDTAQFVTPTTPTIPSWPEKHDKPAGPAAEAGETKPPTEIEDTQPPASGSDDPPAGPVGGDVLAAGGEEQASEETAAPEEVKAEAKKAAEKAPEPAMSEAAEAEANAAAAAFEASAVAAVEEEARAKREAEERAIAEAEAKAKAEEEARVREEAEAKAREEAEAREREEAEARAREEAEAKAKADAEAAAELAAAQAAAAKAVAEIPVQQVQPGQWPDNPPIPAWAPKIQTPGAAPAAEAVERPANVPTWAPQSTSHGWSSQTGGTRASTPAWGTKPGQDAAATQISTPPKPLVSNPPAASAPAAAAPAAPAQPAPAPPAQPAPAPPTPAAPAAPVQPARPAQPAPTKPAWEIVDQKGQEAEPAYAGPTAEDRSYAEWFAWAKRSGAPAQACHAAAQGAFRALAQGHDMNTAVQWATLAMASPPGLVGANRQLYCAWFSLGNIDLKLPTPQAHAFATGAVRALDGGADSMVAHQAGLQAAGIAG